jgi:hypothetical protein
LQPFPTQGIHPRIKQPSWPACIPEARYVLIRAFHPERIRAGIQPQPITPRHDMERGSAINRIAFDRQVEPDPLSDRWSPPKSVAGLTEQRPVISRQSHVTHDIGAGIVSRSFKRHDLVCNPRGKSRCPDQSKTTSVLGLVSTCKVKMSGRE